MFDTSMMADTLRCHLVFYLNRYSARALYFLNRTRNMYWITEAYADIYNHTELALRRDPPGDVGNLGEG